MSKVLFLTATEAKAGKSVISLGVMQLLLRNLRKVAFFRPIITTPQDETIKDHDIELIRKHFELSQPYESTFAFTMDQARQLIAQGRKEELLDTILKKYKSLEAEYDFILCEGSDYFGSDAPFEFEINADIADILGAPVLLIANGTGKNAQEAYDSTQNTVDILSERTIKVLACIVNRSTLTLNEIITASKHFNIHAPYAEHIPLHFIPEEPILGQPTLRDVQRWLEATILTGKDRMDNNVESNLVAAMNVGNFLEHLIGDNQLIITPGDRGDIILASMAARFSDAYPSPAGIVLTGGLDMHPSIMRLAEGRDGMPIMAVNDNTIMCVNKLNRLYSHLDPTDTRRMNLALGLFESSVDIQSLTKSLVDTTAVKISPKMFEFNLLERAARHKMRIVLPEGVEERILLATESLVRRNVAEVILLGNIEEIQHKINSLGLNFETTIIQPDLSPNFEDYAQTYAELRKKKGITIEQARDIMDDPTYFGTMMVYKDDADGMVSGCINTTAHTIRPAFEFIKTKPTTSIVSSVFLMCMKDRVLAFGDCAVNPNPTAEQLANIAVSSAQTAQVFGIEPRVAMLSYSTGASGKGADVDLVLDATKLAQEMAPEMAIEGPLQYDAAIDAEVAKTKMPDSKVAGKATVFIFPDLNTGNNTYKAVQRAANAVAIGPVLQGLNKPVNDLSRGCTVPDIINTVAITAIQAQAEKNLQ